MIFPLSWLNEFINLEVPAKELAEKLNISGFKVKKVKFLGEEITNCVTGKITQIEKHPDSNHLQICKLNCGEFGKEIQIVTGAQNVFEGAIVPVALNGSTLAKGVKITSGKLRGVDSNGMLCSGEELGITEDFFDGAGVNGILILPSHTKLGEDIKNIVGLNDYIFDVEIPKNRPYCDSVLGLAREICAEFNLKLINPPIFYTEEDLSAHELNIEVTKDCKHFVAGVVDNIAIKKSISIIRQRLVLNNIMPIFNIIDIISYIKLELGVCLKTVDLEQIKNNLKVETINEKLVLTSGDACINFDSENTLKHSVQAVLICSAKTKNEQVDFALKRALNLLQTQKICNIAPLHFDILLQDDAETKIHTNFESLNKFFGTPLTFSQIQNILARLNFKAIVSKNELDVTVPAYREDVKNAQDLAYEIIRIYGVNNLKKNIPTFSRNSNISAELKLKNILACQGFSELKETPLMSEKVFDLIKLENDSPARVAIKTNFKGEENLLKTVAVSKMINEITEKIKNSEKNGNDEKNGNSEKNGKFFEITKVFLPSELPLSALPLEKKIISLGIFGKNYTFFTLKSCIESLAWVYGKELKFVPLNKPFLHPFRSASILLGEEVVGFVGQISYDIESAEPVFVAEINYKKLMG